MHDYDTVLKNLPQNSRNSVLELISGTKVERWLKTELPKVEQPRVDLLGEAANGELIHVELQSTNESEPMRMAREMVGWKLSFGYDLVGIRELDVEKLLESPWMSDSVIAILARLRDRRETVRRVLMRISQLRGSARAPAFRQLSILAGLRHLGNEIREEAKSVPILDDIMDHDLL